MSDVQRDTDPTGIKELFDTIVKMSKASRPFGVEVRFDGKRFTGQIKIIGLRPHEINLDPIESRQVATPEIPTIPRAAHRK